MLPFTLDDSVEYGRISTPLANGLAFLQEVGA